MVYCNIGCSSSAFDSFKHFKCACSSSTVGMNNRLKLSASCSTSRADTFSRIIGRPNGSETELGKEWRRDTGGEPREG